MPGDAEEDTAAVGRPMKVFHPALDRGGGAALPARGIEQVELEIAGLAPVGEEGDLPPVGCELGRPVGVGAQGQHPGVAARQVREADARGRLVRGVDQRAGENRPFAVRGDLDRIGDEPAAGPAEGSVQGLRLPVESRLTNISLHEPSLVLTKLGRMSPSPPAVQWPREGPDQLIAPSNRASA